MALNAKCDAVVVEEVSQKVNLPFYRLDQTRNTAVYGLYAHLKNVRLFYYQF